MTTTELQLAKAFRDAGIEQPKAEALATTIFDAIRDNVATKSDVALVSADIKLVEQRLLGQIQGLKLWTGGAFTAGLTILFAALHYWPPK
jgi:hypothetical protein